MAKKTSKFVRVAVEGATSDGRTIEREWLQQIADNYNTNTYTASVNIEHMRGYSPSSEFRSYGIVTAVKVQEDTIADKQKLALYAQIQPTDELIELNKRSQKLFASCEIRPKFADSEQAYLTGLAVTDNPASLGTEILAFAAAHPQANPFAQRKQHPDDLFTATEAFALEMQACEDDNALLKLRSTIASVVAKFGNKTKGDEARFTAIAEGLEQIGEHIGAHVEATTQHLARTDDNITTLRQQVEQLTAHYSRLDNTEQGHARPLAMGGNGDIQTDC